MNNKIIKILILIYICSILLIGCDSNNKTVTASGPQNPASEITGLYEQQQIVKGGQASSSLNLADIQIRTIIQDETELILTFAQGSPTIDKTIIPSKSVPKYETSFAKGVNRMILSMEGISYWSYQLYENELVNSLISGIFVQRPVDRNISFIYINSNTDYAYKVEESRNQLIITFHKLPTDTQETLYYTTLNAFDEYEKGSFDENFNMQPTICADGENIILISSPFNSKEAAQSFADENYALIDSIVPGKKFTIVELKSFDLPTFSEELGLIEVANTPIGYRDGTALSFNPLIKNGRFMDFNSNNSEYVYAQPNTILGAQEGDVFSFEYLYKTDVSGKLQERLLDYQFSSINSAKFSYDSKYVAFVEQNDVLRMLQILSLEDGKLYIPAEDGFGIDTASFVWADDKNILYAINGEFQSKQLLSYDLSDPDNVRVKGIFEQEFSESILQLKGSKIYYAERDNESLNSQICIIDINTGSIEKLADGYSFLLSPDGKRLLINDLQTIDDVESHRLRYIDINTGDETLIQSGQIISDVTWSTTGSRIYYSVFRDDNWDAQYPYSLYYYDIQNKKSVFIMDIVTSALYSSLVDEEVLLMCIFTYKKQPIPITYIVK